MQEYWKHKKGLFPSRNSPNLYPILSHFVPWHFGQGGSVSVLSSNLIISPHALHLYKPFPGFSPVVYIINQFIKIKTRFHHKGLKTYPIIFCSPFSDLRKYLKVANCLSGLCHLLTGAYCGQFPNPLEYFYHKKVYTLNFPIYPSCKGRGLCHASFVLFPRLHLSFVELLRLSLCIIRLGWLISVPLSSGWCVTIL